MQHIFDASHSLLPLDQKKISLFIRLDFLKRIIKFSTFHMSNVVPQFLLLYVNFPALLCILWELPEVQPRKMTYHQYHHHHHHHSHHHSHHHKHLTLVNKLTDVVQSFSRFSATFDPVFSKCSTSKSFNMSTSFPVTASKSTAS